MFIEKIKFIHLLIKRLYPFLNFPNEKMRFIIRHDQFYMMFFTTGFDIFVVDFKEYKLENINDTVFRSQRHLIFKQFNNKYFKP